ncbi:MAG: NFACT RNA binding domain-containing protein [Methanothrix sp.]
MEVKIDFTKSAQDNANDYYVRSKRLAHKAEGAKRSIEELEKRLKAENESFKERSKPAVKKVRKREWYERFHWFNTDEGLLAIWGRDAKQNEKLNSDYFEEGDLFFHADIFGASVVILKNGSSAAQKAKEEAAQFAASYSSAWDNMQRSVDVYCMKREQVSKATSKGSIGTGSFLLSGEREWFRNTQLGLAAFIDDDKLHVVPEKAIARLKPKKYVVISQGKEKKSDAAKKIAHMLDDYDDLDYIMQQIPAGPFSVEQGN